MAEIKQYLNYEGLKLYDEKIKALIEASKGDITAITNLVGQLPEDATEATILEYLENQIAAVDEKIGDISELTGESVQDLAQALLAELERAAKAEDDLDKKIDAVEEKIDTIVKDAPEAFDTLKEIADWISEDEPGAAALVNRVAKNEDNIEALDEKIDDRFNSIQAIERLQIVALFPEEQAADQTAVEAISAIPEGEAVKLTADQTITEDIAIDKSCYIDANGSTFEGTVSVPAGVDVVIENATFAKPVVVV